MTLRLPRSIAVPLLIHAAFFVLVVSGIAERSLVLPWTVLLLGWLVYAPPRDAVAFFTAAIPLFVAIPLATDFDNFNMWRIAAVAIFLRWFFATQSWERLRNTSRAFLARPLAHPMALVLTASGVMALASLANADDIAAGLRRIIFFANAALVPLAAFSLLRSDARVRGLLLASLAWSVIAVVFVGFIQLAATYLMDVYTFMQVWGEGVQLRQFGELWSQIAVRMGNTWLAYYGPQLSLRMFSLFPDSHTFPLYVIMGLGGLLAIALQPVLARLAAGTHALKELLRTRARLSMVWVPLAFLAVLLSGTRGIWAASAGLPLLLVLGAWLLRKQDAGLDRRAAWRYLAVLLSSFYLLFAVAWPIFISPQFLLSKGDWGLLGNRVRSIIDFGETSNRQRLEIWSATVDSIREHPFIGVGIGNYPVILDQHVILAKAGSSAHNIWLHVAAEMGIPALTAWTALWLLLLARAWRIFVHGQPLGWAVFGGWMTLALPWAAAYLLTDAALFDERTLLQFGIIAALLGSGGPET